MMPWYERALIRQSGRGYSHDRYVGWNTKPIREKAQKGARPAGGYASIGAATLNHTHCQRDISTV
jgi:hypothetical protein